MKREATPWKTEAELCDAFMDAARAAGWTCYPETAGWDILLVANGLQIGVQAKLRPNMKVLQQAIGHVVPAWESGLRMVGSHGPDIHAVLVPYDSSEGFRDLAAFLRVVVFSPSMWRYSSLNKGPFDIPPPDLAMWEAPCWRSRLWCWEHDEPEVLPEVIPTTRAGVPCPTTVTPWKIAAIRLWWHLERQGFVTSKDFSKFGVWPSFWLRRWVVYDGTMVGRCKRMVAGGRDVACPPPVLFRDIAERLPDNPRSAEAACAT